MQLHYTGFTVFCAINESPNKQVPQVLSSGQMTTCIVRDKNSYLGVGKQRRLKRSTFLKLRIGGSKSIQADSFGTSQIKNTTW